MPYKDPEKKRAHNKARSKKWAANHPDRVLANAKKWAATHREQRRSSFLMRRYGLTLEAFDSMLAGQGGKCASCGTTDWGHEGPCVDHNHIFGVVRGILCHDCNMSEGLLKTPARAQALADYMKKFN